MRVGILTIGDPSKGLWRDTECLIWALEQRPSEACAQVISLSVFPVEHYRDVELHPEAGAIFLAQRLPHTVAAGIPFSEWSSHIDILFVCEAMLPGTFLAMRNRGVKVIYVPNMDWAVLEGGGVEEWSEQVRLTGAEVWAKTRGAKEALRSVQVEAHLVLWSIPDRVIRRRDPRPDSDSAGFLLNAGMGGWNNRCGVDIALRAFAIARKQDPKITLMIKTIRPLSEYVPSELLETEGIDVFEGMVSRAALATFYEQCDAVLHPSRWEGFGLPLLESLHAGLPVLTTNGWPMNEMVKHEHNGLLIPANLVGKIRLAAHWECDVDEFARLMIRFAKDQSLRRQLTCPDPESLEARQESFVRSAHERLCSL